MFDIVVNGKKVAWLPQVWWLQSWNLIFESSSHRLDTQELTCLP